MIETALKKKTFRNLPVKKKALTLWGWKIWSFSSLIHMYIFIYGNEREREIHVVSRHVVTWATSELAANKMFMFFGHPGRTSSNFNRKVSWLLGATLLCGSSPLEGLATCQICLRLLVGNVTWSFCDVLWTHNFKEHNPGQPCYFRVECLNSSSNLFHISFDFTKKSMHLPT